MLVNKHEIEWLVNVISENENALPLPLLQSARDIITASNYRKSVCVIHPVDRKTYDTVRKEIKNHLNR